MRNGMIRVMTSAGVILASLGLLCCTASGGTSGFGLSVLVNETPRPEYHQGGVVYVEAVRGKNYAIRLTNPGPYRVAVALSVDGLNTINAQHTDARSAAKWVLEPYESTVISGWQVNDRAARNFFFTSENQSYGAKLGQTENLGVIEAVYFRERQPKINRIQPRWYNSSPEEPRDRAEKGQDAESKSRSAGAAPSAEAQSMGELSDDYAATGMGRRARHEVQSVDIDLEDRPVASVRIRYEFRPQLVKMGIFPAGFSPLERRERASGFSGYCPE
jgi:hypothetical protein